MARFGFSARYGIIAVALIATIAIVGAAFEQPDPARDVVNHSAHAATVIRTSWWAPPQTIPSHMGGWAIAIVQSASALGLLAMVLIQAFKQPLRARFHARALRQWLLPKWQGASVPDEYQDLLRLVAPAYARDVLGLPIDVLAAQIAAAVEVALDDPEYASVVRLLAGHVLSGDVSHYEDLLSFVGDDPSSTERPQLRTLLSHQIQRRLDGWQIHVMNEWKSSLRAIAIIISASLTTIGIMTSGSLLEQPFAAVAFIFTVGLLGGLLASVARDLVAIVEKYRR